ncbi:MAG: hypothetical protein U9O65_01555 [Thermotogota bacterium]|nr:hypothetical protein [Thermotogota bacterium]
MNNEKDKKEENKEYPSVREKRKEFTLAKGFRIVRNIEQKIASVNDEKDVLKLLCDSLYDTGKYKGIFYFMIDKDKKIVDEYSRGISNISLEGLNDMISKEKSKCFIYPVERRDIFVWY